MERFTTTPDKLPTIEDYRILLGEVCRKEGIDLNTARDKYGRKTYGEWKQILGK